MNERRLYAVSNPSVSKLHLIVAIDWPRQVSVALCGTPISRGGGYRRAHERSLRDVCNACHAEACVPGTRIDW